MAKFAKIVLNGVEARRESPARSKDMAVSVSIDGLKKTKEGIDASFTYLVKYQPGVGFLKMVGYVTIKGQKKEIDSLIAQWRKTKRMDKEKAQKLINLITYVAGVNGIFAAKTLNLDPPFMTPRFEVNM